MMIQSKEDYFYYLEADRIALNRRKGSSLYAKIKAAFYPDYIWDFQKLLRRLEYINNVKQRNVFFGFRYLFLKRRFQSLSIKLGFTIPINVFGPGLSIAHYGTIVVNGNVRVGANCRLHANVNIGTKAGYDALVPIIGDNVYIGPGAKLYGDIKIANNVAIGANAVVNKSFFQENVAIAGIPAKVIASIDTSKILIRATEKQNFTELV